MKHLYRCSYLQLVKIILYITDSLSPLPVALVCISVFRRLHSVGMGVPNLHTGSILIETDATSLSWWVVSEQFQSHKTALKFQSVEL